MGGECACLCYFKTNELQATHLISEPDRRETEGNLEESLINQLFCKRIANQTLEIEGGPTRRRGNKRLYISKRLTKPSLAASKADKEA